MINRSIIILLYTLLVCSCGLFKSPEKQTDYYDAKYVPTLKKNEQLAYQNINHSTIASAQQKAINQAKKDLSARVRIKIDDICYLCGINDLDFLKQLHKDINALINNRVKLDDTNVRPEGIVQVKLAMNFDFIKQRLKTKIFNFLKQDSTDLTQFQTYCDKKKLIKEIDLEF